MSTYAGNPALATAVKDRVTSTFQQAITLFKHGRSEEVAAGCTLILQMDPLFDPAKKLLEKVRNPASPIDVESLVGAGANDQIDEAREALAARDFQRVVNITTEILTNDLMNDEARTLGDEAREKMEASPFVEQFAKKCEQHLAAGNMAAATGDLEKARSLDATHPAVGRIQQMIATKQAASTAAAAPASYASGAQPSFVVDNPATRASGRPATQATDFGFTFEEDKADAAPPAPPKAPEPDLSKKSTFSNFSFDAPSASGFSFDAPSTGGSFSFDSGASQSGAFTPQPSAAKAPATGDFDFSTASMETTGDDQKIGQYLSDGDRAFDSGDYQQAIDLWSRIFLIDVTNEQASERIEKAKGKRRELEQKLEPVLSAAVQAYDRKDYDTARVKFNEVLRVDPKNPSALEYLARLPEGVSGRPASTPTAEVTTIPLAPSASVPDIFADDALSGSYETPLIPPSPAKADKKFASKAPAAKPSRGLPLFPIVAVIALIVVVAGAWFAWSRYNKPTFDPKATEAVFKQVDILAKQGQYEEAIGLLQDVKPEDPLHDRAVLMIADLQHKRSQGAQTIDGRPAGAFYQEQMAAGKSAFETHDYDGAKRAFEQAMRVKPLPPDVRTIYDNASQQVAKLDGAKSLFRSRQYQDALGNLEQLMQQDPQNQNIRRMIIDAHFNLGATALQEERLDDAITQFDEVLKLDPTDELAKRSRELSVRYNGQPKDMLFKIYVKYLPSRQVS